MGVRNKDKRNLIFTEFDNKQSDYWFSVNDKKVVHNIDSLYFNIYVSEPYTVKAFIQNLDSMKDMAEFEPFYVTEWDMHFNKYALKGFDYCLDKEDNFQIFFKRTRNNSNLPLCRVQIASALLWEIGEYQAVKKGFEYAKRIMEGYYTPFDIKECRVDYAYHTNYIRSIEKFVNAKNLNKVQV
ncbi:MAG: hypothetical protein ACRCST_17620, partial [Turicibacter sp.]